MKKLKPIEKKLVAAINERHDTNHKAADFVSWHNHQQDAAEVRADDPEGMKVYREQGVYVVMKIKKKKK